MGPGTHLWARPGASFPHPRGHTKADWDHSVKILVTVLNKFKVPEKEPRDLFA